MIKYVMYSGFLMGSIMLIGGLYFLVSSADGVAMPPVLFKLLGFIFTLYGAFRLYRSYVMYRQMKQGRSEE